MAIRFFLGINICKKEAITKSLFEQCGHGPVTQFITPKDHTHTHTHTNHCPMDWNLKHTVKNKNSNSANLSPKVTSSLPHPRKHDSGEKLPGH